MGLVDAEIAVTKNDVISGEEPVILCRLETMIKPRALIQPFDHHQYHMQGMTLPGDQMGNTPMTFWLSGGGGWSIRFRKDGQLHDGVGSTGIVLTINEERRVGAIPRLF
jgi:hypothetical protein